MLWAARCSSFFIMILTVITQEAVSSGTSAMDYDVFFLGGDDDDVDDHDDENSIQTVPSSSTSTSSSSSATSSSSSYGAKDVLRLMAGIRRRLGVDEYGDDDVLQEEREGETAEAKEKEEEGVDFSFFGSEMLEEIASGVQKAMLDPLLDLAARVSGTGHSALGAGGIPPQLAVGHDKIEKREQHHQQDDELGDYHYDDGGGADDRDLHHHPSTFVNKVSTAFSPQKTQPKREAPQRRSKQQSTPFSPPSSRRQQTTTGGDNTTNTNTTTTLGDTTTSSSASSSPSMASSSTSTYYSSDYFYYYSDPFSSFDDSFAGRIDDTVYDIMRRNAEAKEKERQQQHQEQQTINSNNSSLNTTNTNNNDGGAAIEEDTTTFQWPTEQRTTVMTTAVSLEKMTNTSTSASEASNLSAGISSSSHYNHTTTTTSYYYYHLYYPYDTLAGSLMGRGSSGSSAMCDGGGGRPAIISRYMTYRCDTGIGAQEEEDDAQEKEASGLVQLLRRVLELASSDVGVQPDLGDSAAFYQDFLLAAESVFNRSRHSHNNSDSVEVINPDDKPNNHTYTTFSAQYNLRGNETEEARRWREDRGAEDLQRKGGDGGDPLMINDHNDHVKNVSTYHVLLDEEYYRKNILGGDDGDGFGSMHASSSSSSFFIPGPDYVKLVALLSDLVVGRSRRSRSATSASASNSNNDAGASNNSLSSSSSVDTVINDLKRYCTPYAIAVEPPPIATVGDVLAIARQQHARDELAARREENSTDDDGEDEVTGTPTTSTSDANRTSVVILSKNFTTVTQLLSNSPIDRLQYETRIECICPPDHHKILAPVTAQLWGLRRRRRLSSSGNSSSTVDSVLTEADEEGTNEQTTTEQEDLSNDTNTNTTNNDTSSSADETDHAHLLQFFEPYPYTYTYYRSVCRAIRVNCSETSLLSVDVVSLLNNGNNNNDGQTEEGVGAATTEIPAATKLVSPSQSFAFSDSLSSSSHSPQQRVLDCLNANANNENGAGAIATAARRRRDKALGKRNTYEPPRTRRIEACFSIVASSQKKNVNVSEQHEQQQHQQQQSANDSTNRYNQDAYLEVGLQMACGLENFFFYDVNSYDYDYDESSGDNINIYNHQPTFDPTNVAFADFTSSLGNNTAANGGGVGGSGTGTTAINVTPTITINVVGASFQEQSQQQEQLRQNRRKRQEYVSYYWNTYRRSYGNGAVWDPKYQTTSYVLDTFYNNGAKNTSSDNNATAATGADADDENDVDLILEDRRRRLSVPRRVPLITPGDGTPLDVHSADPVDVGSLTAMEYLFNFSLVTLVREMRLESRLRNFSSSSSSDVVTTSSSGSGSASAVTTMSTTTTTKTSVSIIDQEDEDENNTHTHNTTVVDNNNTAESSALLMTGRIALRKEQVVRRETGEVIQTTTTTIEETDWIPSFRIMEDITGSYLVSLVSLVSSAGSTSPSPSTLADQLVKTKTNPYRDLQYFAFDFASTALLRSRSRRWQQQRKDVKDTGGNSTKAGDNTEEINAAVAVAVPLVDPSFPLTSHHPFAMWGEVFMRGYNFWEMSDEGERLLPSLSSYSHYTTDGGGGPSSGGSSASGNEAAQTDDGSVDSRVNTRAAATAAGGGHGDEEEVEAAALVRDALLYNRDVIVLDDVYDGIPSSSPSSHSSSLNSSSADDDNDADSTTNVSAPTTATVYSSSSPPSHINQEGLFEAVRANQWSDLVVVTTSSSSSSERRRSSGGAGGADEGAGKKSDFHIKYKHRDSDGGSPVNAAHLTQLHSFGQRTPAHIRRPIAAYATPISTPLLEMADILFPSPRFPVLLNENVTASTSTWKNKKQERVTFYDNLRQQDHFRSYSGDFGVGGVVSPSSSPSASVLPPPISPFQLLASSMQHAGMRYVQSSRGHHPWGLGGGGGENQKSVLVGTEGGENSTELQQQQPQEARRRQGVNDEDEESESKWNRRTSEATEATEATYNTPQEEQELLLHRRRRRRDTIRQLARGYNEITFHTPYMSAVADRKDKEQQQQQQQVDTKAVVETTTNNDDDDDAKHSANFFIVPLSEIPRNFFIGGHSVFPSSSSSSTSDSTTTSSTGMGKRNEFTGGGRLSIEGGVRGWTEQSRYRPPVPVVSEAGGEEEEVRIIFKSTATASTSETTVNSSSSSSVSSDDDEQQNTPQQQPPRLISDITDVYSGRYIYRLTYMSDVPPKTTQLTVDVPDPIPFRRSHDGDFSTTLISSSSSSTPPQDAPLSLSVTQRTRLTPIQDLFKWQAWHIILIVASCLIVAGIIVYGILLYRERRHTQLQRQKELEHTSKFKQE